MQIYMLNLVYLLLLWRLKTQFFESKLVFEKISCFEMANSRALDTFTVYSNISKIRLLIQTTLRKNARRHMDISKTNRFSVEEAINYIPRTKKRKKVRVCEMFETFGSSSFPMFPILSWELKIKVQRHLLRFLHHLSRSCFVNTK